MACAFAVTLICALITGLWPAWKSSRARGGEALASGSRTTSGQVRLRQAIVLVQIAIATALVAAGALLVTSFLRLTAVPPGFTADRTLLADISLPAVRYERHTLAPFFAGLLERIRALPGVESAGAGGPLPLSGLDGLLRFAVRVEGGDPATDRRAYLRWVTPGYFDAMGIEVRSGRVFSEGDTDRSAPVVVIDAELARRFFPDQNPIGKRMGTPLDAKTWREIVGVVAAVRQSALDREVEPHLYFPQSQVPSAELTLVVRSAGDAIALAPEVRRLLRDVDPTLPLSNVRPLADLVATATAPRRIGAQLLSVFAGLALLLTLVGVYGVVSQVVAQSTRELGVRIALGATRADVMSLVVLRAVRIALAGVLAGAVLAWLTAPALRAMLYGVGPRDPWTLVIAAAALTLATALAAWVPARRILRLDVVNALRVE
jgi:putative ABC transport system permease protein